MNQTKPSTLLPMWLRVLRNPLVRIVLFFVMLIAFKVGVGKARLRGASGVMAA